MTIDIHTRRVLLLGVVFIGLFIVWSRSITEAPVVSDAVITLRMGVNLAHNGVLGDDYGPVGEPTMYREPVPAIVDAFGVLVVDAFMGKAEMDAYFSGPRAKYLKYQNIFWAAAMTLAMYGLLMVLTNSFPLAVFGAVVVNFDIPLYTPKIDDLLTEPVALALLVATAFLLALWVRRGSRMVLCLAGISFGLLTLTKAAFLYVFIGMLIIWPIVHFLFSDTGEGKQRSIAWRKLGGELVVLAVAFGVVTFSWMGRNYIQLGSFSISERAGLNLLTRTLLNQATKDEYHGWFWQYAPNRHLKGLIGSMTGFGPDDLLRGGRLQRITDQSDFYESDLAAEEAGRPEDVISLITQARAWRVKLTNEYRAAGHPRPGARADEELKKQAIEMIKADPWGHIAFILPAWYAGALFSTPVLLLALFYSLRSRRKDLALTVLPSLGMIALYALGSMFEHRFGTVVMPLTVAVALVLLLECWRRLRRRAPLDQDRG